MRACSNLGQLDQRVSNAVKTRQEVDLRIGELRNDIGDLPFSLVCVMALVLVLMMKCSKILTARQNT